MSLFGGGGGAFGGGAGGGGFGANNNLGQQNTQNPNTNGSYMITQPELQDGISCMAWSTNDALAAGSWDCSVTVWSVQSQAQGGVGGFGANAAAQPVAIQAAPAATYRHDAPVLCVCFTPDGQNVISGGADNTVRMKNLASTANDTTSVIVGRHDMPVKDVFYIQELQMIVSGSWDKSIRFWDGKNQNPQLKLDLSERVYSMDVVYPVMVVAMAERRISVYNIDNIKNGNTAPIKQGQTALKMQTRTVRVFPNKEGYAVGSIEGRCSIVYFNDESKNFAFKCHRSNEEIFAVNAIAFHPNHGTFATAGSDGIFTFWDKDNRQRLKQFQSCHYPITATAFNGRGNLFAYAVSYDWSKGHEHNMPAIPRKIMLHAVVDSDVQPKAAAANNNRNRR